MKTRFSVILVAFGLGACSASLPDIASPNAADGATTSTTSTPTGTPSNNTGAPTSTTPMPNGTPSSACTPVAAAAGAALGSVTVVPGQATSTVPQAFLGLSHEWASLPYAAGALNQVHPAYLQMLRNLASYKTGGLILRVGGDSQDQLATAPPTQILQQLAQLASGLSVHFIYGVNLESNDHSIAQAQVSAGLSSLGPTNILAFEIGNEPDIYPLSASQYVSRFSSFENALTPLLPNGGPVFAGPAWAEASSLSGLANFLGNITTPVGIVTVHSYAQNGQDPTLTPASLLDESNTAGIANQFQSAISTAHAASAQFRLGETNSLYNGGKSGVSDTFAAALWSIDFAFETAGAGIDGINFHGGAGLAYSAISESAGPNGALLPHAAAPYYGYLFFQQAVANGAAILPVTINVSTHVKAWAVQDTAGNIRVALLNKDASAAGQVTLAGLPARSATMTVLSAPSLAATSGINFAGQTIDDGTGTLGGTYACAAITPGSDGLFHVPLGVAQAVLLTIPAP